MFCYASDDGTDYTRHSKIKGREFSIKLDDINRQYKTLKNTAISVVVVSVLRW